MNTYQVAFFMSENAWSDNARASQARELVGGTYRSQPQFEIY